MKTKNIIIALAALALSVNVSAQEFNFGIKGGLGAYWIPGSIVIGTETSIVPHNAFYGGFYAAADFGDFITAQAELIYSGKGHSDRTAYGNYLGKYSNNLHYIQLPVMIGTHFFDKKATLMIGPEFGYCFAAQIVDNDSVLGVFKYDVKEYVNPCNLALAIQANYMFSEHFGIDVKFDFGITKTFKDIEIPVSKTKTKKDSGHNSGIHLGVCYAF